MNYTTIYFKIENENCEEAGLNSDYFEWGVNYEILEKRIQL